MNAIPARSWKSTLLCWTVIAALLCVLGNLLWNRRSWLPNVERKVVKSPICVVKHMDRLPQEVIDGVERFVFFIGWPRSGHSIVASLMDGHPNMLIANQFSVYRRLMEDSDKLLTKEQLFDDLYNRSVFVAKVAGLVDRKGYTLHIEGSCQGSFTELKVIGEKTGGLTMNIYRRSAREFYDLHNRLTEILHIPLRVIQVIRNPYDMIATEVLYEQLGFTWKQNASLVTEDDKFHDTDALKSGVEKTFRKARNIQKMRKELNLTVLEIHNSDLIHYTRETIQTICKFLDVDCPEWYLELCDEKVYKQVSRSRLLVNWDGVRAVVKTKMRSYPFFSRYTFYSD